MAVNVNGRQALISGKYSSLPRKKFMLNKISVVSTHLKLKDSHLKGGKKLQLLMWYNLQNIAIHIPRPIRREALRALVAGRQSNICENPR
jgi:hypothetical protein